METGPKGFPDSTYYVNDESKMRVIYGGLGLVEKHKASFPETFAQITKLIETKVNTLTPPNSFTEGQAKSQALSEVASAVAGLVQGIAR